MHWRYLAHSLLVASLILLFAGCKPSSAGKNAPKTGGTAAPASTEQTAAAASMSATPTAPIERPLALPRPRLPPNDEVGLDFATAEVPQLISLARASMQTDSPRMAAMYLRWAAEKGSLELLELAGYEARGRRPDEALYWLQEAALREGVAVETFDSTGDFADLRSDARFAQLRPFLGECQAYWSKSGIDADQLVLPAHYQQTPVPVIVWLHRGGDGPASCAFAELQSLADQLQVAFLSVSGPLVIGPRHFSWSADMSINEARIAAALAKAADRVNVQQGQVVLAGFSHGGQVAGELAAAQGERYCGALLVSPGGFEIVPANRAATEANRRQTVIAVAESASVSVVNVASAYAEWFRAAGADATFVSNEAGGALPLREWTAKLLKLPSAGK